MKINFKIVLMGLVGLLFVVLRTNPTLSKNKSVLGLLSGEKGISIWMNDARLGLHVGNINTGTQENADKTAKILNEMGVKSVRMIYQNPTTKLVTAKSIKELNKYGIDVLVTIMPFRSDYSDVSTSYSDYPNGSDAFAKLCGSPNWRWMYKYSTVDQNLYKARLESLLTEINKVGATVTAFEIGNEADWACFNGDIPVVATGNANSPYDLSNTSFLSGTVKGYAKTLKTSYLSIKALHPKASVLTFGAANTYLYDPKLPHIYFPNFLLWLTNVEGTNYLAKYSNATAMHFYPQVTTSAEIAYKIGPAFTNVAKYRNKFWITEFGFGKSLPQYTSNPALTEKLRLASYLNFLSAVNNLNQVIVDRAYLYSYEQSDWTIMSPDSTPLDSASIFAEYAKPRPFPTLDLVKKLTK